MSTFDKMVATDFVARYGVLSCVLYDTGVCYYVPGKMNFFHVL